MVAIATMILVVMPRETFSEPYPDGDAIPRFLEGRRVEEILHVSLIDRERVLRSPAVIAVRVLSVPIILLAGSILLVVMLGITLVSLLDWLVRLILRRTARRARLTRRADPGR